MRLPLRPGWQALTEDGHAGATYVLTGPETVTRAEQVRLIGEAIGRPVRWEEQSRQDARPELIALFGDEAFADRALDAWAGLVRQPERVTSTEAELTGASARTFRQWVIDHADAFRDMAATTRAVADEPAGGDAR